MNFSQVNLSTSQVAVTFLNRFQVLPQHCPCALKLGFTYIVRFVSYDPRTPFCVCERGFPFRSEDEAKRFCQIKIKHAIDHVLKFSEQERERFASVMLREDGKGNYTVHPTYDALLIKYLPELLLGLNPKVSQPLPTPSVDVTKWCNKLENKLSKSLKHVEFFVAYTRTKGKDLSKALDLISNRVNAHTEMVNTWADIWLQHAHEKMVSTRLLEHVTKSTKRELKLRSKE